METICLKCGDKGFTNAFVYCVKCLKFATHRYCLDTIPKTFDEFVYWVCGDDCEGEALNHDLIPSRTRDLIVVSKDEHIPTNDDSVDNDESAKDRTIIALHSPESLPDQIDDEAKKKRKMKSSKEKKDEHTLDLDEFVKLLEEANKEVQAKDEHIPTNVDSVDHDESAKDRAIVALHSPESLPDQIDDEAKKKPKKKRKMKSSKEKKDEHTLNLDDVLKLFEEANKEVQAKDDTGSKQRGKKRISSKRSKKKKKKKKKMKRVVPSEESLPNDKSEDVKNSEENKCSSPSNDNVKQGELEDKTDRIVENIPMNLHITTAEPVAMPIWTGCFDILKEERVRLNGILAHVSILACMKVYDEALQFRPVLQLHMLPKNDVWPKSFEKLEPRGDNIALYFFPSKAREQDFDRLVDEMMHNELALKATVQNAELLIFNSTELPLIYWKFQGKSYLWGVFRQKNNSPSNSHPCRAEAKDENSIKPNNKDRTSSTKP